MKLTQESLQRGLLAVMAFFILLAMIGLPDFGNLMFTIFFVLVIVVLPFWLDSLVRYKVIPFLDSLNVSDGRSSENFPLWMRVSIWAFVGILMAGLWTVVVPAIFGLPLWIGRLAQAIGWRSLPASDGVWQFGWLILFLIQYLIDFGVGLMLSNDTDFEDRFDYPNE